MPHLHEKVDLTAEVYIVFRGKVLLRIHDKYKLWLAVGGHIEHNEDPNQAAIREVQEEVGLRIRLVGNKISVQNEGQNGYHELIPPQFMNRHRISETHEHVSLIFVGLSDSDVVVEEDSEKSGGIHWFTKEELQSDQYQIQDSVRQYALAALAMAT